jgi:hypothetical protein
MRFILKLLALSFSALAALVVLGCSSRVDLPDDGAAAALGAASDDDAGDTRSEAAGDADAGVDVADGDAGADENARLLHDTMQALAARTRVTPLTCAFEVPGQTNEPGLHYHLEVAPLHLGDGDNDASFSLRFVTDDDPHATQEMLVSYIPSVAPDLEVMKDAGATHIQYVFGGFFDDGLVVDVTAASVAVAFIKTYRGSTIMAIRCDASPTAS